MEASKSIKKYFQQLNEEVARNYLLAEAAHKKGIDPDEVVPIPLANNMAERVVGLISVVAPQIINSKVTERILELEKEYGMLDWRVGFKIAEEVAGGKLCPFETKLEALEVGIRTGFAYLTLGIVSAPLEGFIGLKIKKRHDGKEYFALQYAGPIRAAGGTAASVSVILSDYVRVKMGYAAYDPDEAEINRCDSEIHDYHERVTNLQYHPSEKEVKFMASHLPVEVDGDPTEKLEVSNYKDLPRIETNLIRGGMALVLAEGLCQKTPKLWKRLSKWGEEFGLGHWNFLADFIKLKESLHTTKVQVIGLGEKKKVKPNTTYIMDLVAGRPILTHPLAPGGFRLRYGRTRMTGFSASALHPATLIVLDKYIAIGTQIKVERPGKASVVTVCDSIEGPIVLLENGSVLQLGTESKAKEYLSQIKEILFLGDLMFNYGDFSENGQDLVPAGYCPEWWALEVEKAVNTLFETEPLKKAAGLLDLEEDRLAELIDKPLIHFPEWNEAVSISKKLKVSLHPDYTFYWKLVSGEEILNLRVWLQEGKIKLDEKDIEKIILPYYDKNESHLKVKKTLENMGVAHQIINKDNLVLARKEANIFALCFDFKDQKRMELISLTSEAVANKEGLEVINLLSSVAIKDKAGTFIGARMGRPEKAKMRSLTGSPQVMFPVGEEGDRLRSFQSALLAGKIRSAFPNFYCLKCQKEMIYPLCEECGDKCEKRYYCRFCGDLNKDSCRHGKANAYKQKDIDIAYYFEKAKARIGEKLHPDLIKGVRGTSNKGHITEHLAKGILRAKHNIYVNKDGTTRYDCTEMPLTHFKPKEVKTSIAKLKELGYELDFKGKELVEENQILELKPQDIILPGFDSLDESAPKVLTRVANFIDELLVKFYGLKPFYNLKTEEDLIGHLVIGLAPHISAGLVGRIVGFSETQGLLAHPMYHAGMRRDCVHPKTRFVYEDSNGNIYYEKIGDLVEKLIADGARVTPFDSVGTLKVDLSNKNIFAFGVDPVTNKIKKKKIKFFIKGPITKQWVKITTATNRNFLMTPTHDFLFFEQDSFNFKKANCINAGDRVPILNNFENLSASPSRLNLISFLIDNVPDQELAKVYVTNKNFFKKLVFKYGRSKIIPFVSEKKHKLNLNRWYEKTSLLDVKGLVAGGLVDASELLDNKTKLRVKFSSRYFNPILSLDSGIVSLLGYYAAEGYSRRTKTVSQVSFRIDDKVLQKKIIALIISSFGIIPNLGENSTKITVCDQLVYLLFKFCFRTGSNAYEKRVPSQIFNLPLSLISNYISAFIDGDGSVILPRNAVVLYSVNRSLLDDISLLLTKFKIFSRYQTTAERFPGKTVLEIYNRLGKQPKSHILHHLVITGKDVNTLKKTLTLESPKKRENLRKLRTIISPRKTSFNGKPYLLEEKGDFVVDYVKKKEIVEDKVNSYCFEVEWKNKEDRNVLWGEQILNTRCDGDEAGIMLLMDALLNFSRQYLPERRGAKSVTPDTIIYYEENGKIKTEKIGFLIDGLLQKNKDKVKTDGDYEILEFKGYKAISFDKSSNKAGFYPITKFIRHHSPEQIYQITTSHGKIKVTGDHSVFVSTGQAIKEKEVREIGAGENIITLAKFNLSEEKVTELDLVRLVYNKIYVQFDRKMKAEIKNLTESKRDELIGKYGINYSRYAEGVRKAPLRFVEEAGLLHLVKRISSKNGADTFRYLKIDKDLAGLSAYLIAEGYLRENKAAEITNTNQEVVAEIKDFLEKILQRRIKVSWSQRKGCKDCARIRIPTILTEALIALGHLPVSSENKHLPPFIFKLSPKLKEHFLTCYRKGDGHHYQHKNFSMLYSKSPYLAAELSLLAHSLGKKTSISQGQRTLQILYSDYNNTDPWWPLTDLTKTIYRALRKEGLIKKEIHQKLSNYYAHKRTKTASKFRIKEIINLLKHQDNQNLKSLLEKIYHSEIVVERVRKVEKIKSPFEYVYDLEVPEHQNFLCGPHPIFAHNTMDSPLVLTSTLYPSEVDDQVHGIDVVWKYPLEFYEASLEMKKPWEVVYNGGKKIEQLGSRLGKELQYEQFGYTHEVDNFNRGVLCSAYKILPSMEEKLFGQMEIARKVRAVNMDDVAKLVIQKHFLKDIRGNLKKFSAQQFRCGKCNTKYRRPPLSGKCTECNNKLMFTISEGSVIKYLGPSLKLAEKYDFSPYLKQVLNLLKLNVDNVFGKEKEKQVGLGSFSGS